MIMSIEYFLLIFVTKIQSEHLNLSWEYANQNNNPNFRDHSNSSFFLLNNSNVGQLLGSTCDKRCSLNLKNVYCNLQMKQCVCIEGYPVKLNHNIGCELSKTLDEQCFFHESCEYNDKNALCAQINYNAICKCKTGYHKAILQKPVKKTFCSQDVDEISTNKSLSTLFGVVAGITLLSGLICFVLKLFAQSQYPRSRHYANANVADLNVFQRNAIELGSRRPSLISIQSNASSVKSYGAKRLERDRERKEEREMQLRLAKMKQIIPEVVHGRNKSNIQNGNNGNIPEESLSPVLEKVQSCNCINVNVKTNEAQPSSSNN